MNAEKIQQSLEKLKNLSTMIEGVALVSMEGFIMASVLPDAVGEERIAGLSASFMALAGRCTSELGKGEPLQLFIQAQSGIVAMLGIGDGTCLCAVASKEGKPGMVLFDMKRAAEEIRPLLENF
jgi:predicted regulator of Ras-like GTPase activity (Roadblock/LC7/MglB family)